MRSFIVNIIINQVLGVSFFTILLELFLCVTNVSVIYILFLFLTPLTKSPSVIPVAKN